jgi:hypothetical protein
MRTVEPSLTNAVKRFVGRICDLAKTRGTETRQGRQSEAQALGLPEPPRLLTGIIMARKEPAVRQQSKPRKNVRPLKAPEGSGFFPVVTSNLLNMFCVTVAFATVLAVLLGVAKWT